MSGEGDSGRSSEAAPSVPHRDRAELGGSSVDVTRRDSAPAVVEDDALEEVDDVPQLGRYILLERLGRGGMGVVHAAYDPELERKLAIKVLAAGSGRARSEYTARLLREAQAMARVRHPNVVTIHDVGTTPKGELYLAMEYVKGQTLGAWLDQSRRPWREILATLIAAGRGLAAAHAVDIVHRDFKPDNVMVDEDGHPQVLDFGLAHTEATGPVETCELPTGSDPQLDRLTRTGTVMGTPAFMSPEQFRALDPDERSDQFSFCVTAWRALYRRKPFGGDSYMDLAASVTSGRLQPPPRSSIPARLRRTLEHGLAIQPEDRFQSMDALLDALQSVLGRRRKATWLAGSGVLGLTAAGLGAWSATQTPCTGGAETIREVYGLEQAQAIEKAMVRTDVAYAQQTWNHVHQSLSAYALDWQDEYTQTCEATHVRKELPQAAMERRMMCLDKARMELRSVVELLSAADANLLANVQDLLGRLTAPAACRDVDETRGTVLPPGPEDRLAVEEIERLLARVDTLRAVGRPDAAREAITEAEQMLEHVHYGPIETSVRLARGQLDAADHPEDALQQLEAAQRNAARWGQWDLGGRAAMEIATTAAVHHGDASRALAQVPTIVGVAERFPRSELAAQAHATVGTIMRVLERMPEAETAMRKALELRLELHGPRHPKVASDRSQLASTLVQLERTDEALQLHEAAIEILEEAVGPRHPAYLSARVSHASTLSHAGRGSEAVQYAAAALATAEEILGPRHRATARMRTTYAGILRRADALDEGESHARRAIATLSALQGGPESRDLVLAQIELSHILRSTKEFAEAERILEDALSTRLRTVGGTHPDVMHVKLAQMSLAEYVGDYERAKQLTRQVLDARIESLGNADPTVASTRMTLAHHLTELGEFDAAKEQLEQAMRTLVAHSGPEAIQTLQVRATLGNVLLHLREYARAEHEYAAVSERYAEVYGPADSRTLRRRGAMAMAIAEQGRCDQALSISKELLALTAAPGYDRTQLGSVLYNMAEVFAACDALEDAMASYGSALEEFSSWMTEDHPVWAQIHQRMAEVALRQGDLERAASLLRRNWDMVTQPTERGRAAFVYAQAIWPAERNEALRAARVAEQALLEAGARFADDRAEVTAWIQSHR